MTWRPAFQAPGLSGAKLILSARVLKTTSRFRLVSQGGMSSGLDAAPLGLPHALRDCRPKYCRGRAGNTQHAASDRSGPAWQLCFRFEGIPCEGPSDVHDSIHPRVSEPRTSTGSAHPHGFGDHAVEQLLRHRRLLRLSYELTREHGRAAYPLCGARTQALTTAHWSEVVAPEETRSDGSERGACNLPQVAEAVADATWPAITCFPQRSLELC